MIKSEVDLQSEILVVSSENAEVIAGVVSSGAVNCGRPRPDLTHNLFQLPKTSVCESGPFALWFLDQRERLKLSKQETPGIRLILIDYHLKSPIDADLLFKLIQEKYTKLNMPVPQTLFVNCDDRQAVPLLRYGGSQRDKLGVPALVVPVQDLGQVVQAWR